MNTFVQGTQPEAYVQWTGPVVAPQGERRTERDVFADLSERLGHPPIFTPETDILSLLYDAGLDEHGLSMAALRATDGGVAVLAPSEPGTFLDRMTTDGTLDGNPAMLEPARRRAVELFAELAAEPADQLKLITRRTSHTINSAMQNVERLKKGIGADNPLFLSPIDAERLAVVDGAEGQGLQRLRSARSHRQGRPVAAPRRGGHDPRIRQRRHHRDARGPALRRRERQRPHSDRARHLRSGQHHVAADRHPRRCRGPLSAPGPPSGSMNPG